MSRIPSTAPIQSSATSTGNKNDLGNLDIDQFLKLLITELQNQDPLDPLDNSEILNQISQIREISATNKLSETLDAVLLGQNMATASTLIGRRIHALTDDAQNVEGTVDRVTVDINENDNATRILRVHIGEHRIDLRNIREILGDEEDLGFQI